MEHSEVQRPVQMYEIGASEIEEFFVSFTYRLLLYFPMSTKKWHICRQEILRNIGADAVHGICTDPRELVPLHPIAGLLGINQYHNSEPRSQYLIYSISPFGSLHGP